MKHPITYLGKHVGAIEYPSLLYLTPRRPEHYFIKFRGFGLSTGLLRLLSKRGVRGVIFIYTKKNGQQERFLTPLEAFYAHGTRWTDREADTQLILPLSRMQALP